MVNDQAWMIYLAAPYSSTEPGQEYINARLAELCAWVLMGQGHMVYAPTVHGRVIDSGGRLPYETWIRHGLRMLGSCDELFVLCLKDWDISEGVCKEIAYALEHDMPIRYVIPDVEVDGKYTIVYTAPQRSVSGDWIIEDSPRSE